MKNLKTVFNLVLVAIVAFAIQSCGGVDLNSPEGYKELEGDLKSKFGDDAYYTMIVFNHSKSTGTTIAATATSDPSSLKMEEWVQMKGVWQQTSEVTLEISSGKPEDFMYNLNDVSIAKMGELTQDAIKRLKKEKDIDGIVKSASVIAPNDGNKSEMTYSINLEPKNGGTDFTFNYKMDGTFDDMTY